MVHRPDELPDPVVVEGVLLLGVGQRRLCVPTSDGFGGSTSPFVGHQPVAVDTGEGTTVIAADAVPAFDNVRVEGDAPFRRGLAMDDFAWWGSAHAVTGRADRRLPGHAWESLDADSAGLVWEG